jgi:hypothetical protein
MVRLSYFINMYFAHFIGLKEASFYSTILVHIHNSNAGRFVGRIKCDHGKIDVVINLPPIHSLYLILSKVQS